MPGVCHRLAFNARRQAFLAIDHAVNIAGAGGAQRLAAGAAIGGGRRLWMVDAVHAILLSRTTSARFALWRPTPGSPARAALRSMRSSEKEARDGVAAGEN